VASVRGHFVDQLDPGELSALAEACEPILDKLRTARDRD